MFRLKILPSWLGRFVSCIQMSFPLLLLIFFDCYERFSNSTVTVWPRGAKEFFWNCIRRVQYELGVGMLASRVQGIKSKRTEYWYLNIIFLMILKFDLLSKRMVVQSFQFKSNIFLSTYYILMQNDLLKIK